MGKNINIILLPFLLRLGEGLMYVALKRGAESAEGVERNIFRRMGINRGEHI